MRYHRSDRRKIMHTEEGDTMAPTPIAEAWATSNQAPLWVAVALYGVAQADPRGTALLARGQLRAAIGDGHSPQALSMAIRRAVQAGWLHQDSSARCLRLTCPGGPRGA